MPYMKALLSFMFLTDCNIKKQKVHGPKDNATARSHQKMMQIKVEL